MNRLALAPIRAHRIALWGRRGVRMPPIDDDPRSERGPSDGSATQEPRVADEPPD